MKIVVTDFHCPGDSATNMQALRDLHNIWPELQMNVEMTAMELFENVPWLDRSVTRENADKVIPIAMPLINRSNQNGIHAADCVREYLASVLNRRIPPGDRKVDIYLSDFEKTDVKLYEDYGIDLKRPWWLVNGGYKSDYPLKFWGHERYQKVIDLVPEVQWIQVGSIETDHHHQPLNGVIDLRGKTTHRQLVRLMYRASGCLCGITYVMHLATMEWAGHEKQRRPCVVIAGGREPDTFTCYPGHRRFSTVGLMDCCQYGGCWKGDRYSCQKLDDSGIPECMRMIEPEDVAKTIRQMIKATIL